MHFEKNETIEGISPNAVLSSLETHLSAVALEVVRTGARLTAYGIGPSPRIVNPNDTTVVEAKVADGSALRTMLRIEVNYQASALLGDSAQDEVVWRKIQGALLEMRGDLRMRPLFPESQRRSPQAVKPGDSGIRRAAGMETAAAMTPAAPVVVAPGSVPRPIAAVASEKQMELPVVATEPMVMREEPVETALAAAPVVEAAPVAAVPELVPEPVAAEELASPMAEELVEAAPAGSISDFRDAVKSESLANLAVASPLDEVPVRREPQAQPVLWKSMLRDAEPADYNYEEDEEPRRRVWPTVAGLILLLGVGGASAYAWLHQDWAAEQWKTAQGYVQSAEQRFGMGGEASSVKPAETAAPIESAAPVETAAPEPAAAAALDAVKSAEKDAKVQEPNVKQWIANWGEAMQSDDAAAQAVFYANVVPRYLQRSDVSNEEVLQDKQLAIEDRVGQFSVKVEDVVVEAQNSTQAWARLVKHYVVRQSGSAAMERRVRSTLHLRKMDGVWKIVEERDLP